MSFFIPLAVALALAGDPKGEPKPPSGQAGRLDPQWTGRVLRVEFLLPGRRAVSLGTGFVIRDRSRQLYLLTCAHLLADKDWESRYAVRMRTMDGRRRIESLGSSVLVGRGVDLKHPRPDGWPDLTTDLVARAVDGGWAKPLVLAVKDPEVGEPVWAVGCEAHAPRSDERLFAGKVVRVKGGAFIFEMSEKFDPHGFSGGPVVNRRGEVVGNVVAGTETLVSGATVTALRRRLAEAGVVVD